jgi:xanthine dehydrogenase YagS FAD-binding subunit
VSTSLRLDVSMTELFGDGRDGSRDNTLAEGEQILTVSLPVPMVGERAVYRRAISRALAEWPLVEVVARLGLDGAAVRFARVAVGGVAPVPLRLLAVEAALVGHALDATTIDTATRAAIADARPLPMTAYKVTLLEGVLRDVLGRCV